MEIEKLGGTTERLYRLGPTEGSEGGSYDFGKWER